MAQGCSNKQIAAQLGISPRTVGNTLTLIYRTTGAKRPRAPCGAAQCHDNTGERARYA